MLHTLVYPGNYRDAEGLFYISHYSAYLKLCDPISSSFSVKFGIPYKVQTRIGAIYFLSLQVLFSSFKKNPKTIIRGFSTFFWFEEGNITGFSLEPRLSSRNTLLLLEHWTICPYPSVIIITLVSQSILRFGGHFKPLVTKFPLIIWDIN